MPGHHDDRGEWVPGATTDVELRASVQPLALEDADLAGGVQLRQRLKCYVLPRRERVGLAAAFEQAGADKVIWQGATYVVEESRTWSTFTRATLLRES